MYIGYSVDKDNGQSPGRYVCQKLKNLCDADSVQSETNGGMEQWKVASLTELRSGAQVEDQCTHDAETMGIVCFSPHLRTKLIVNKSVIKL